MTSYLRKYVTAFASAKDYVAQWSADHVYADEPLIVPFPTLAIFDPERCVWSIRIKAWLYLPFEGKKIKSYLPSFPSLPPLPRFLTGKTEGTITDEEKKSTAAMAIEEDEKQEELSDDDIYEDALCESKTIVISWEF